MFAIYNKPLYLFKILILTIFLFAFSTTVSFAQGTSNEGKDFWIAYAGHVDNLESRLTLYVTSKVNAIVTVDVGGTPYAGGPVSLEANKPKALVINPNLYTNVYVNTRDNVEIHSKKGIHVTADQPIVVYSHISRNARSAACLVYPTPALGHDYYAISYSQLGDAFGEVRSSQFTIVGVENNTEIEITPTQASRWLPIREAGVPFIITLNKGDIFQYQSKTDITGSHFRSVNGCKPFSVFSGSSKTGYCEEGNPTAANPSGQDNLYQQLLPIAAWGRNFVTSPSYNATRGNVDIYRIQVSSDNTTVTVNGSVAFAGGLPLTNPYAKGSVITFTSQSSNTINATNPINVAQFQTSQTCNPLNPQNTLESTPVPGDPEMIILNPIEQTLKDITVYSAISTEEAPTNITSHYINAIIKTVDIPSFTIDGLTFSQNSSASFALNSFIKINNEYSYLIADVTASSQNGNPSHRILANGGFIAIAYGYGIVESYGYLAGSDLRNLNQYIQPVNSATNAPAVSGCSNMPLKLYVVLPYKTGSLKWDIGDGRGFQTDTEPDKHYTTEVINGVLSYKYSYFKEQIVYNKAGTYPLKVAVVNPSPVGCDANETVELAFTVYDLPMADYTTSGNTCANETVTFTDKSSGNGLPVKNWLWDFGDGTPVLTRNSAEPFEHLYTKSGDFPVTLTVETSSGCPSVASKAQIIHIAELPKAKFTYALCDEIQFTDSSTTAEGNVVKWLWNFGNPESGSSNTSELKNPVHTFSKVGAFTVSLTVTTDKGCSAGYTETVFSKPSIDAGEDITILRDGEKALEALAIGSNLKYKWTPAIGLSNDSIPNPIASPQNDTKYTITITAKSGCKVSDDVFVTVVEPFVPNAFSPNGDEINDTWAIKYLDTYPKAAIQIFNRFGQIVYKAEPFIFWDGTFNGQAIPVGVYYYILAPNNGRKNIAGSLTIIR